MKISRLRADSHRTRLRLLSIAAAFAVAVAAFGVSVMPSPDTERAGSETLTNRYGVAMISAAGPTVGNALSQLGLTWWYTFDSSMSAPAGSDRVKYFAVAPSCSGLAADTLASMVEGNRGSYWLIGSEPNVPRPDEVSPDCYARSLNYYATTIKSSDASAKIVGPNILNWNVTCTLCADPPAGRDWVPAFVDAYQQRYGSPPPIDIWGIHAYNLTWDKLPMTDAQSSIQQIQGFRAYLNTLDSERDKPIWLTEFGVVWGYEGFVQVPSSQCRSGRNPCFGPGGGFRTDLVRNYLTTMLSWLNTNADANHIEKWFLYTNWGTPEPYASVFGGISLLTSDKADAALTEFGQLYKSFSTAGPPAPPAPGSGSGGSGGPTPPPSNTPPSSGTPNSPSNTGTISPTQGGQVTSTTATVTVPSGAVTVAGGSPVTVSIAPVPDASGTSNAGAPSGSPPPGTLLLGASAFTITMRDSAGNEIHQLTSPIDITVPYTDEDLRQAGGDPNKIHLRRFDETTSTWVDLGGVADPATRTITVRTDHLSLFALAARLTPPEVLGPLSGTRVQGLGPLLDWRQSAGTAQFQVQVLPFNNDGPGINLIIGAPDLVAAARYQVPAPVFGEGNYIMLPGMTYTWRVRTTPLAVPMSENDPGWSDWASAGFRTPPVSSATIGAISPSNGQLATSLTPTVRWSDLNSSVFYYEVQVSPDPNFETDPAKAVASVYWNLVHGGVTEPPDSYAVPDSAPLGPDTVHYWRVRPRIQGDGEPIAWSDTWSFRTP